MDAHTLRLLEFDKIRRIVASYAASSLGRELAEQLGPLPRLAEAIEAHTLTRELIAALDVGLHPPLGGLRDIRTPVKRAKLGVLLTVEQITDIQAVLHLTGRAHEFWMTLTNEFPALERLLSEIADMRHIAYAIENVIDERGNIRSDATPDLSRIRAEIAELDARIEAEIRRLVRNPEIRNALRYNEATLSGEHHVLPVAVNHRGKVPGVVHRTSSSGETVFIEPAKVVEINAEKVLLVNAEEREVRKVLRQLTTIVARDADRLLQTLDILAQLDLLYSKAQYARDCRLAVPKLVETGPLRLESARHPLLVELFRGGARLNQSVGTPMLPTGERREVVPISLHLGDDFRLLLITGPNTGGKTAALKTVGLCAVMARAGLPIPARPDCQVPFYDAILADIGDEQSLEQSLSTFSAHVTRIAEVFRLATERSLILFDELGAGTEPSEGSALGRAILDELRQRRCQAMVTTHLNDLKTYALRTPDVENAAVEFDAHSLRPTYRLLLGQTGESCALRIAERLNLPGGLLERAQDYLDNRERTEGEDLLRELQELRAQAERAREEARQRATDARRAEEDYRRRQDNLAQEQAVIAEIEKARATLRAGDTVRVPKFEKAGKIKRIDHRRGLASVTVGAMEWELPIADLVPVRD